MFVKQVRWWTALVLGFFGALIAAACGPNKPTPKPGLDPGIAVPPECNVKVEEPCMRYKTSLLGNPSTNEDLRDAYIAAFGDACYMSDAATPTFNCFYKTWQKACEDAVMIGEVSGNAAYDKGYTCQPVLGTKNYTLQIGSDPAIVTYINYDKAPRQDPKIDVGGVPTEVNGPYRNLPEPDKVAPGEPFYCQTFNKEGKKATQWYWIIQANLKANGGVVKSDLSGYEYPCPEGTCKEPENLEDPTDEEGPDDPKNVAEVHHVVPMADKRSCPWGTNSNKNAAVISRKLNRYFWHNPPPADEVAQINAKPAYAP